MSTTPLRNLFDPHTFAFETGYTLRGLSVTQHTEGYNCIVRACNRQGEGLYCLTVANSPLEGLWRLWEAACQGNGSTIWRTDKFFSKGG